MPTLAASATRCPPTQRRPSTGTRSTTRGAILTGRATTPPSAARRGTPSAAPSGRSSSTASTKRLDARLATTTAHVFEVEYDRDAGWRAADATHESTGVEPGQADSARIGRRDPVYERRTMLLLTKQRSPASARSMSSIAVIKARPQLSVEHRRDDRCACAHAAARPARCVRHSQVSESRAPDAHLPQRSERSRAAVRCSHRATLALGSARHTPAPSRCNRCYCKGICDNGGSAC